MCSKETKKTNVSSASSVIDTSSSVTESLIEENSVVLSTEIVNKDQETTGSNTPVEEKKRSGRKNPVYKAG